MGNRFMLAFLTLSMLTATTSGCVSGGRTEKAPAQVSSNSEVSASSTSSKSGKLSDPKATKETQALYTYLCDSFGKVMISCQQESTWMGSEPIHSSPRTTWVVRIR